MIKRIVVFPGAGRGEVTLELHGELAAILAVAQGTKNKAGNPVSRIQVSVVGGSCNHLDLQLQGLLAAVFMGSEHKFRRILDCLTPAQCRAARRLVA